MASFSRLILHDRRGTGLSRAKRSTPEPRDARRRSPSRPRHPGIGASGARGSLRGGAPNVLLAASDPERVRSILWWGPSASSIWSPTYPWGAEPDSVEADKRSLEKWGTAEYAQAFAEAEATAGHIITDEVGRVTAFLSRQTVTPDVALALSQIWNETDVRGVLPAVRAPALLLVGDGDPAGVAEGEYIASLMPNAELKVFHSGPEETLDLLEPQLDAVRAFVGIERPPPELDTVLVTVLFTDIVGATEKQVALGDHDWKRLVEHHHAIVRDLLGRWRGLENDTAGDGFFASFDGPARAIRCAMEAVDRIRDIGVEIRAGVHTGECELIDGKCGGLTVSIGARVASSAGASEILVSQTVKDLVAGSGLVFEDAGEHELKGVPDRWHLYRVGG